MKLRNKKTGEVVEAIERGAIDLYFYLNKNEGVTDFGRKTYNSISELNDEWEYYEPKEPLIKDEKVRKAVRAVADISGVSILFYEYNEHSCLIELYDMNGQMLQFKSKKLSVKEFNSYTIDELCGEEEE